MISERSICSDYDMIPTRPPSATEKKRILGGHDEEIFLYYLGRAHHDERESILTKFTGRPDAGNGMIFSSPAHVLSLDGLKKAVGMVGYPAGKVKILTLNERKGANWGDAVEDEHTSAFDRHGRYKVELLRMLPFGYRREVIFSCRDFNHGVYVGSRETAASHLARDIATNSNPN